jgi:hypothetical protein
MLKNKAGVKLQNRDFEILRFCLEMKFSDIESLNFMFFDPNSLDMFAARKRIQKLESSSLLKSVLMLSGTTKKFYITTSKGIRELQKLDTQEMIPGVLTKLSIVTFEHDLGVLKLRRLLEEQKRATNWKSEKLLKAIAKDNTGSLRRDFLPDAIFTSKHGKVVALEFENKPKTETQLREKIFRLNAIMENHDAPFVACLFVASTDNLKKKIRAITGLIQNRFIVHSMSEIEAPSLEIK